MLIFLPLGALAQGTVTGPRKSAKHSTATKSKPSSKARLTPNQMHRKGIEARNKSNNTEAVEWFRKAAEQGHAAAQCDLGTMYWMGHGVKEDHFEAAKWFRKSAEQGFPHAQWHLGKRYEYGAGVEKSLTEAVEWYRKGAENGDLDAQMELGRMYENGIGVEKNLTEAKRWYQKACDQNKSLSAREALERLKQLE